MVRKTVPAWLKRVRERARKLLRKNKPAKYGPDIDLEKYSLEAPRHRTVRAMAELDKRGIREPSKTVGTRDDEKFRSGTYFQHDHDVVYLAYTKWLREHLPKGLIVMNTDEAAVKYSWLRDYWFKELPLSLDKYTAYVGVHSTAGAFVWVKRNVRVDYPIQACLFMGTDMISQVPHNFIIAEPNSSVHLITGCVVHPKCREAAHVAATEIYVKRGAEVTWTMIHNWKPEFHVRPRMGAVVEAGGTLILNYILLSPIKSIQLYPTVVLKGKGARTNFRNLIFGREKSDVDVGSGVMFNSKGTRGEITSRAVVTEGADVKMRGLLQGNKPESRGHLECRGLLLSDQARARAYPSLIGVAKGTDLTHEAAVGKIAEEQLHYLMSRGLAEDEATSLITRGFLDTDIPGLPEKLRMEIGQIVSMTTKEVM